MEENVKAEIGAAFWTCGPHASVMDIRLGAGMISLHFVLKLLFPYFWKDFWHLMKLTL